MYSRDLLLNESNFESCFLLQIALTMDIADMEPTVSSLVIKLVAHAKVDLEEERVTE